MVETINAINGRNLMVEKINAINSVPLPRGC